MTDPAQIAEGAGWGATATALLVLGTKVPWRGVFSFIRWGFNKRVETKVIRRTTTLENDVNELKRRLAELEKKE